MAGTVALTNHFNSGPVRRLVYSFVADAGDGSVPTVLLPALEGRLLALATNPGATAPTDNYDITLVDQNGLDRLFSGGLNRHTTSSQQVPIVYTSSTVPVVVSRSETLTLTIANNSINSAIIVVEIIYGPVCCR